MITKFITGPAGTGKTWRAKQLLEECVGTALCATTGIAAINLGEGVTTVNSLLGGYFDTDDLKAKWENGKLLNTLSRLYGDGLRHIVIDEVSMLDGRQLSILADALKFSDKSGKTIDITLVGDFCQLPPVNAPFAFESEAFGSFRENMEVLTEVKRQDDLEFVEALQKLRRGDMSSCEYFSRCFTSKLNTKFDGVTIVATNKEVDAMNLARHKMVQGQPQFYDTDYWGKEKSEWRKNIPDRLGIKEGALVMILANQREVEEYDDGRKVPTGRYEYVNGDLGHVVGQDCGQPVVRLLRDDSLVTVRKVRRHNSIPIPSQARLQWLRENHPDRVLYENERESVGHVYYVPLRLAYATTVHKSQGLSLDNVQVSLDSNFFRSPGMLYVALSRARSIKGLTIVGDAEKFKERVAVDQRVKQWI